MTRDLGFCFSILWNKNITDARRQWLMAIILATWEAEIRRIVV
jgi:hypothetical protein